MELKQRQKSSLFRLIALAMAFCMLGSAFLEKAASAASSLADIRGAWSERTLLEWMDKGWLTGYPDGTVRPKLEVTRAEFFSLANKSLGFVDEAAISFSDVKPGTWKAKQAAIAVQAGYAEGYPDGTMQPDRKITREEVSVMVAKAFELKLSPEETTIFKDAASISNAGKGAVGALVANGILKGYLDGTFRPKKVITREEAVVILDGALKKLERKSDKDRAFSAAGAYGPADGTETIAGNAVVEASGVTLRNMEIQGDLLLSANIGEGEATLDNVKVKGAVTVNGGGPNSIYLKDSQLELLIVDKKNGSVRIVAEGSTTVKRVDLRSGAKLESDAAKDKGFRAVHLTKEMPAGSKAILLGEFAEANVASSKGALELIRGAIQKLNVLSGATGNTMNLQEDTQVVELTLEEEAKVQGQGEIDRAILGERAKGSTFERAPGKLEDRSTPAPTSTPSPGTGGGGGSVGNQDTTPPAAPVVTGVQDQGIYAGPVTPNWSDASGTASTATLIKNGSDKVSYTRDTEIAEDGSYILSVTARKNSNGRTTTTTIHFTIDSVPPAAPKIEGVANGGRYFSALPDWTDAPNTVSEALISQHGHGAKPYERGTRIVEVGDYVLTVTATKRSNGLTAATTVRFSIDSDAAVPALIKGVEEGGSYSSTVITWTDAPDMNSTAMLAKDGGTAAPFTSGTEITEEGDYVLTVTTRNVLSYLTVEQQIHFTINSGPPQPVEINITGPYEPTFDSYRSARLSWTDPVGTTSTAMLKKDDEQRIPYEKNDLIDQDGDYVLTVTSTKLSNGLTVTATKTFKVITWPKSPIVTGFADKGIYLAPVTMSWEPTHGTTIIENSLEKVGTGEVRNDIRSPQTLIEDGTYYFTVLVDKNGQELSFGYRFVITGIRDVEDGQSYESVTPTWVDPIGFGAGSGSEAVLSKDGEPAEPYSKGTAIDEPGEYELTVTWRTGPDHSSTQSVQFDIDSDLPEPVEVTGVENGGTYASAAATWTDAPGMTSTATLAKDGGQAEPYAKGTEIDEDGSYALEVTTRKDSNGREVQQEISFTINSDSPMPVEIIISGHYRPSSDTYASASLSWTDPVGTISTAMLKKDDEQPIPYVMDDLIYEEGDYVLTVTSTKLSSGLTATAMREFKVLVVARPPIVSGFANNGIYFAPVTMAWELSPETTMISNSLENVGKREVTNNIPNPTILDEDGTYKFSVVVEKDGEEAPYGYRFFITGIRGVEDGQAYESVTPTWVEPIGFGAGSGSEAVLSKNGEPAEPYWKGTTIDEPGEYELTVTWRVGPDMSREQSVQFVIDSELPEPVEVTGVENGRTYVSTAATWTDASGMTSTATLAKDGGEAAAYTSGTGIAEDGSYVLKLTTRKDSNGREVQQVISFTIDSVPPMLASITIAGESRTVSGQRVHYTAAATWTDRAGTTSTAMLQKGSEEPVPYTKDTIIDQDGDYVLTVTTTKQSNGLTSTATREFKVDGGPQPPVITGFSDNAILFGPIEMSWTPPEGTIIEWVELRKSNEQIDPLSNPMPLDEAGEYEFSVGARKGDDIRVFEYRFIVAGISGIEDKGVYSDSVTPDWFVPETLGEVEATLKKGSAPAEPYTKGTPITEPDNYVLTVTWSMGDNKDVKVSKSVSFRVENSLQIDIYGGSRVIDGVRYFNRATVYWTQPTGKTGAATLLKIGDAAPIPWPRGKAVEHDGDYEVTVTWTDASTGETSTDSVAFKVNSGPAEPIVSGIMTNEIYSRPVIFSWTPFEKTTVESVSLTRRDTGETIATNPSELLVIDQEGEYEFKVKVRRDHETAEYTYRFVLAWVSGLESFEHHISVTPNWFTPSVFSTNNRTALRKDGQYVTTYKRGDAITEKGSYILEVSWRIGENIRGQTLNFEVDPDFLEPIEVTGIEPRGTYESAAATWTNNSDVYASAWIIRNQDPKQLYENGSVITKEGNYALLVYTYSRTSSKPAVLRIIPFTIVPGPPAPVTVTGVVYGGSYLSASPTWDDAAGLTITAALSKDGGAPESYEKGTPITEPGSYVLTVTAAKENGQTAVTEIAFTIVEAEPEKPVIELNGEPNGRFYYSVAPTWTDAEGTTSTATLTRLYWGEETPVTSPYERGTPITEQDEYVLTVTATKSSNGLTSTTTVTFTVTDQVP